MAHLAERGILSVIPRIHYQTGPLAGCLARGWIQDCSESLEDLLGNRSKTGPRAMAWDRSQGPFWGPILDPFWAILGQKRGKTSY